MRELPAAQLEVREDRIGHDLRRQFVTGQPRFGEVTQDAPRHLPQRHAQVEQDAVAVGHGRRLAQRTGPEQAPEPLVRQPVSRTMFGAKAPGLGQPRPAIEAARP